MKLSVVINTLNEQANLPKVLSSVEDIADEIVVVDMESDDQTVEIAQKLGARVYTHKRTGYVEPARNYAISKAKGDWVLVLDADETATPELKSKIKEIMADPEADYFRVSRKNMIFGKWIQHSNWWPDYNIRFFRKGFVDWSEKIHSIPITKGKGADLSATEDLSILHHNYDSIDQYLTRLQRYTKFQSNQLVKDGYKFDWTDLITKPANEFLSRYFQGQGYKDGLHGLALAGLQAFSELVLYLKVWEISKFKARELNLKEVLSVASDSSSDFNYWKANSLLAENGGVRNRIKRRLKLS